MSEPIHVAAIGGIILIADGLQDIDLTDPAVVSALRKLREHPVMKKLMIGAVRYEVRAILYKSGAIVHEMITDRNALFSDEFVYFQGYAGEGDRVARSALTELKPGYWEYKEPTPYPDESQWVFDITALYPCGAVNGG